MHPNILLFSVGAFVISQVEGRIPGILTPRDLKVGDVCPNLPDLKVCSPSPLKCAAVCCYDGANFVGQCNAGDSCYRSPAGQWSCCPAGRNCAPAPPVAAVSVPPVVNQHSTSFVAQASAGSVSVSAGASVGPGGVGAGAATGTQSVSVSAIATAAGTVIGNPIQGNILSVFASVSTSLTVGMDSNARTAHVGSSIMTAPPPPGSTPMPPTTSSSTSTVPSAITTQTGTFSGLGLNATSSTSTRTSSSSASTSTQTGAAAMAGPTGWVGLAGVGAGAVVGILGAL